MSKATSDTAPHTAGDLHFPRMVVVWLVILAIGLSSRTILRPWSPEWMLLYGGDVFWAAALYGLLAMLGCNAHPNRVLILTYLIAVVIELSQLYQAPWINQIRQTIPFNFILGQGFLWSDLAAYAMGAIGMSLIDRMWLRRTT